MYIQPPVSRKADRVSIIIYHLVVIYKQHSGRLLYLVERLTMPDRWGYDTAIKEPFKRRSQNYSGGFKGAIHFNSSKINNNSSNSFEAVCNISKNGPPKPLQTKILLYYTEVNILLVRGNVFFLVKRRHYSLRLFAPENHDLFDRV